MMKRQKKYTLLDNEDEYLPMQKVVQTKFENTIEAQIQDGDTLQALALRFHCTVAEIKRLNKIDKDNEIYARKIIKVPITPHSILLETLPTVHKSGQSSPKLKENGSNITIDPIKKDLEEKLLIASVNSTEILRIDNHHQLNSINDIILNSNLRHNRHSDDSGGGDPKVEFEPILSGELDDSVPQPRSIPVPTKNIFDFSGSDCDISWICLLICILALCFAIPLVYVFYIAEHPEKFQHNSN